MKTANQIIKDTLNRVTEMIWWNRGLSKLNVKGFFNNYEDFIKNQLIEKKGIYIEYIKPPIRDALSFLERSKALNLEQATINSIIQVFAKDDFKLYKHQTEAIEKIIKENKDLVLSVPTATGKTEAFFIPIIDYSVKNIDKPGLKAIIIYPTKTLEVDQFNRFIEYLYYVNEFLDTDKKIRISIWDGDTPHIVGDPQFDEGAVEPGTPLRGILCPICKKKLILNKTGVLKCEVHDEFYFINAVRDRIIKTGTDILITNPEALDFLLTNPDEDRFNILGSYNSEFPCKFIVYDEGHIWTGLSGTSISLLSKRLRCFYKKNEPQFLIVSATIANPSKLGQDLLDVDKEAINVVRYYGKAPRKIDPAVSLDFLRWKYCVFSELIYILILIEKYSESIEDLKKEEGYVSDVLNVIHNLIQLKLITSVGDTLKITKSGKGLLELILRLIPFNKKEELNIDLISDKLSHSLEFSNELSELFYKEMKELYKIIEFFEAEETKPIIFKKLEDLIKNLKSVSQNILDNQEWKNLIEMYLSFGQFANLLINRYHFFIKSPEKVFLCPKCKNLTLNPTCFSCKIETLQLKFCRNCHHPYLGFKETAHFKTIYQKLSEQFRNFLNNEDIGTLENIEVDEDDKYDALEEQEIESLESDEFEDESYDYTFEPLGYTSYTNTCPNCNRYMPKNQLYTGGVYFSTFISFILSALPRMNNSHKVLVFSDSRRNAETIGSEIMEMDYKLIASKMFVNFLKNTSDLSMPYMLNTRNDLWTLVRDELKSSYYEFLIKKIKDRKGKKIINDLWQQSIYKLAFINNHRHLFSNAILIVKELFEKAISTKELIVGQELFRLLNFKPSFGFQIQNFKFRQSTVYSKLKESINRRIMFMDENEIDRVLPKIIKIFYDIGIIELFKENELIDFLEVEQNRVSKELKKKKENFKELVEDKLEKVKKYLNEQKNVLNKKLGTSYETGVIKRPEVKKNLLKSTFNLKLLETVYFCEKCYSAFPCKFDDLNNCPVCKNKIRKITRLETSGPNLIFNSIPGNIFNIDHWAEELIKYAIVEDFKDSILKIGIHRAGLPYSIRGAIEESFRKGEVNIVSATPTMELGIDIGKLNCALLLGIPPSLTNYIQRCGRTGRSLSGTSLIFTVIRNSHAIDEYYFDNLNQFFSKLDKISIPHYTENKFLLAGHILTYILTYLARNPSPKNDFINIFALKESYDDPKRFVNDIMKRIGILIDIIERRREEILKKLELCFGQASIEVFDQLIDDKGDLSLWQKSSDFFRRIEEFSKGYGIQYLSEVYHNITSWCNLLGFVANYRGFGENIAISIEGKTKDIEIDITEIKRAIRENFPGKKSTKGAIFRFSGVRYVVDKVWGSGKIGEVKVCPNIEGNHPYIVVKTSEKVCPFCGTELEEKRVYKIKKIIGKVARGFAYNYNTYAYMSNSVDIIKKEQEINVKILNFDFKLFKGKFNHLEFTSAFSKKFKYQQNFKLIESEARIEDLPSRIVNITSRKAFLESTPEEEEYAPIGNKDENFGLCLTFNFNDLLEKITINETIAFLVSFNQVLKRAISIIGDCELNDFDLFWIYEDEKINYYLLEGLGGTQGISALIYSDLTDATMRRLPRILKEFINCKSCGSEVEFCSKCLLLRRTPEFYLRNRLLRKSILKYVLL